LKALSNKALRRIAGGRGCSIDKWYLEKHTA
jgi:hypothetical protein